MAKPAKQQPTINELGGLPPEFEADTQQEQNDNKVLSVPDVQERTAENETEGDDSTSDSDEMEVVVVKGQTLRHSGETHVENTLNH